MKTAGSGPDRDPLSASSVSNISLGASYCAVRLQMRIEMDDFVERRRGECVSRVAVRNGLIKIGFTFCVLLISKLQSVAA